MIKLVYVWPVGFPFMAGAQGPTDEELAELYGGGGA